MDKLQALSIYWGAYRTTATQLCTLPLSREWMETMDWRAAQAADLEAHARQAAAWASAGYTPAGAAPLIAQGVTPETAAEMEQLAVDVAGGPAERTMQVVDDMLQRGLVVAPWRVDPDDPTHIIVDIVED